MLLKHDFLIFIFVLFVNLSIFILNHRLPFVLLDFKAKNPFDLVHSNLWGASPVASVTGVHYFLLFIDDFSHFTWLYLLKSKYETYPIFLKFKALVETQFSTKIKALHSNWGGEYKCISTFLSQHGIHHKVSCPSIPKQNGRVECKIVMSSKLVYPC